MAYDAARAAVGEFHPDDDWLKQRMALALAQMGSAVRAQEILYTWPRDKPPNRETLSILGRTYKDQWCANPANEHPLRQSFDCYNRAFEIEPPDFYPGINAATVAFLSAKQKKRMVWRGRVLEICQAQPEDYWRRRNHRRNVGYPGRPGGSKEGVSGGGRRGPRQFARTLFHPKAGPSVVPASSGRADFFDECFPVPKLVIFSGHMIDAPDRRVPRFPRKRKTRSDSCSRRSSRP